MFKIFALRKNIFKKSLLGKKRLYLCSRFENEVLNKNHGPVVQLVRMPACHAGGREFESRPDRSQKQGVRVKSDSLFFCPRPKDRG